MIHCVLEIESKKFEIDKLWHNFFHKKQIMTGYTYAQGHMVATYQHVTQKNVDTTDEDVAEYEQAQDEYDVFIEDTIEKIKSMVCNGADLTLQDQSGKTVLDYCSVEKVYNVLRDLGAPFSLKNWSYFHLAETVMIGIVVVPVVTLSGMALVNYVANLCK